MLGANYCPHLAGSSCPSNLGAGIASTVLISALQFMIILDLTIEGFDMPSWGWLMLLFPIEGVSLATCYTCFNAWCDGIFGAMGLDLILLFAFKGPDL